MTTKISSRRKTPHKFHWYNMFNNSTGGKKFFKRRWGLNPYQSRIKPKYDGESKEKRTKVCNNFAPYCPYKSFCQYQDSSSNESTLNHSYIGIRYITWTHYYPPWNNLVTALWTKYLSTKPAVMFSAKRCKFQRTIVTFFRFFIWHPESV